jgi:hypothetical protein
MATKRHPKRVAEQRESPKRHLFEAVSKLNDAECRVLLDGMKMREQGATMPEVEKFVKAGWEGLS